MDDNSSWKSQGFMLVVFAGIVFLCSIFFVLGMLVGRSQGQKFAAIAAAESPAKDSRTSPDDGGPGLSFPEPPALAPVVSKEEPSAEPPVAPEVAKTPATSINWQISALKNQSDAEKKLADVRKLGFPAFILSPPADDPVPYYRVQVGPYADSEEAEIAKKRLESIGLQVIKR